MKRALAESQEGVTAGLSWKEQLEAVSLECARWEAELQTSAWRIAELEQRTAMLKAILDAKGNATSMEASRTPREGSAPDGIAPEGTSRALACAPAPDQVPGSVAAPVAALVPAPQEDASEGGVPSDSWG